jgi:hypothetical protein
MDAFSYMLYLTRSGLSLQPRGAALPTFDTSVYKR